MQQKKTESANYRQINKKFYQVFKDNPDTRFYVLYGGAGSGKSIFVIQYLLMQMLQGPHQILVLRKWRAVVRESVIEIFKRVAPGWGIDWDAHFHKTNWTLTINKSRIVFGGLDNVEKYKGTSWDYIWIEEATDIIESDFSLLNLRLGRDTDSAKFILTFNPVDENHWLVQRFVRASEPLSVVDHSTYKDNAKFLSITFKDQLRDLINKDENFYRVYALGEPGILKGLIYHNWSIAPGSSKTWDCAGLDFGFNNPSAMVRVKDRDGVMLVDECLYQSHLTNTDLIEWLKANHDPDILIYADSAEPQRIEEIKKAGFRIISADKSVRDGIDRCKSVKLQVTDHSGNLIKELQSYKWREKGGITMDEPVKVNDHLMDAMRYAIYTHYKQDVDFDVPEGMWFF